MGRSHALTLPRLIGLVAVTLAAVTLLGACSTKQDLQKATGELGNPVPIKDFVGTWTPKEVAIDGSWNGSAGAYDLNVGSQGGGFIVADGAQGPTVQIVGSSGAATTPLPATLEADTLTFALPRIGGGKETWRLSIPDASVPGAAQFEIGSTTVWDLEQVDSIPTGG